MIAMILAAGLGQRMRPLTDHTPKPLLRVAGKALLDYHLENLASAGITQVVINLAYLGDSIRAHVGSGQAYGLAVEYSPEPEPLETGGALLQALPLLGNAPFLLLNGDVWCDLSLSDFSATPLPSHHLGRLLLVPNPDFHPEGDFFLDEQGQLRERHSPPASAGQEQHTPKGNYTFAGISLLHPELISNYPQRRQKFPLVEALRQALPHGQLGGQLHLGHWSDVGTPERLQQLEQWLGAQQR